jgi:hypothetical protein
MATLEENGSRFSDNAIFSREAKAFEEPRKEAAIPPKTDVLIKFLRLIASIMIVSEVNISLRNTNYVYFLKYKTVKFEDPNPGNIFVHKAESLSVLQ